MKRTHGMYKTSEYSTWENVKQRCYNPGSIGYEHYGGRGIEMCSEWKASFIKFYNDMGPKPSQNHSIERMNVNGNYEPNNCMWVTRDEQCRNKRNSELLVVNGHKKLVKDWCEQYNVSYQLVKGRLRRGWPISVETILTPAKGPAWNSISPKEILYEVHGENKRLKQWCKDYNIDYRLVWNRIKVKKWDTLRALTTPVGKFTKKQHNDTSN